MPNLDFANPLHTFDAGRLTYTATKDCYLLGSLQVSANGPGTSGNKTVTIDGTTVFNVSSHNGDSYGLENQCIPCTKIASGSTVVLSAAQGTLHIFEEG